MFKKILNTFLNQLFTDELHFSAKIHFDQKSLASLDGTFSISS